MVYYNSLYTCIRCRRAEMEARRKKEEEARKKQEEADKKNAVSFIYI